MTKWKKCYLIRAIKTFVRKRAFGSILELVCSSQSRHNKTDLYELHFHCNIIFA